MNQISDPDADTSWHLDKRVNVSIIFMLASQIAVGAWVASSIYAAVEQNRKDIAELQTSISIMRNERNELVARLIRVEEKLSQQIDILREIRSAVKSP